VSGDSPVPVTANLSGLQPGTVYHYRLDATDANGTNSGQDQEFTTLGPGIHGESVVNVTSSSATVQAQINPDKADTTYYIQYGTSTSYGTDVPTPPGPSIGSGESDQGVSVPLEGLQPDTTYHYRVVAVNGVATVEGADEIFTTQLAGGALALPDGRDWELVSPPNKNAALIGALEEEGGVVQASEDGGAVTYGVAGAIGSDPAGNRAPEWSQVLSVRSSGGWSSQDIAPLHEAATGIEVGELSEYKVFSPELSLGLVEPKGETPLSPPVLKGETQEKTIYLHADAPIKPEASLEGEASPEAIYGEAKKSGGYLPLITAANVPPGTKFGQKELYITFVSATPDLSHVLFISPEALTSNAFKNGQERSIYEWAGGALQLVSVLPDGKPASEEAAATGRALQPAVGYEEQDVRHAVSNDGSRVFWSSGARGGATGEGHLYMRDVARGETIQIDVPESGVAGSSGEPHYQTASSDGSKVFFTDQERLTADSTASSVEGDADLYECEVIEVAGGEPACKLTDVTVDHNPEENAGVQNLVLGSSEVGSYLYFVATGVLSDVANGEGERAVPGAENLYVSHYAGGEWTTRFIAALSSEDAPDWNMREEEEEAGQRYTTNSADLRYLTARVSPDGRYVAFMSEKSLTGYDNTDANSGQRDEEVFLYDANAGRLLCASCDPTGARPVGVLDGSYLLGHQLLVDQPEVWVERWLAGSIPGWTPMNRVSALYQSRYLSDNGRLFFDSADALSPHVTTPAREEPINGEQVKVGTENVYEYEPQGIGSCGSSSETFSESSGGCVGLISSGTSSEESAFLDASASGGDVFFLTASQLAPGDYDTALDVYDAHGCTEASPCLAAPAVPSPRCNSGESCRPAPSPQPAGLGASGSATFSGAGNLGPAKDGALPSTTAKPKPLTRAQKLSQALKACRKKPKRKRVACEKQARKKYGAKPRAKQSRARKSSSGGEGRQRGSGR
jgi:hypothetical protein